jgi:hypothetical protein
LVVPADGDPDAVAEVIALGREFAGEAEAKRVEMDGLLVDGPSEEMVESARKLREATRRGGGQR